ncbi:hypothetical protein RHMOL_Rhmol09G0043400 [Rhododendron molle]|uniref:Uncharacterized protein n=1 Tax=Rhododendron molle TaxID=49168 RepID=A0ACC0MAS1_RHOML|nr:hypothetical protein RHMOL_Rhmol09G0043400 [Rhododendron molle]
MENFGGKGGFAERSVEGDELRCYEGVVCVSSCDDVGVGLEDGFGAWDSVGKEEGDVRIEAAKILANLIIMGSGIMARAVVQAYRQALANAAKSGVAQETVQNAVRRGSKTMTEQEARQILGVTENSTWEEIAKKYDNLFENNAKNGSFYLQSKVHRAKECLEPLYQPKDQGTAG